jgi:hypothetical protein
VKPAPALAAVTAAMALAVAAGTPARARAQATGTTAGAILDIPATARMLGLGGAYTAVVGDEGSVFANPAGLAPIRHVALGTSYQRYVLDSYLVSGAAAFRVGRFHLGLGAQVLNFGQDTVYRPDPAFGGERGIADPGGGMVGAYDAVAVGSLCYRFGMLSLGGNVKYLKEHISIPDTTLYDASGVGFDVGAAAAFFDIAAIGVVVQNLGRDLATSTGTPAPLPRTVRAGLAINLLDPQETPRLFLVTDWVAPRGAEAYWIFGLEGGVVPGGIGILGRVGITAGGSRTGRRTLVVGGGLVFHSLRLDYGYEGFDALGGATHRFGIEWLP